jgi:hypothetical protein
MILHLRRFFGRVSAVLALLLITQLSFAGHLCLSIAASGQAARSSTAQPLFQADGRIAPQTASPCCSDTSPAPIECVADPYRVDFGAAVRPPLDNSPASAVSAHKQWVLAETVKVSECSGFADLPRRPLSVLFCRYLD